MIKRSIVFLLAVSMAIITVTGCSAKKENEAVEESAEAVTEDNEEIETAEFVEKEPRIPVEKADTSQMKIDYKSSEIYSKEDMDAAIKVILDEFSSWDGCVLHSIEYTDDQTCTEGIDYLNELGTDETFEKCIVFTSSFHSPIEGGGAWEEDVEYEGWQWYLGKTAGGDWELLTWGY